MKFSVRAGFVVHDTKVVTLPTGGSQERTNSYYEGDTFEADKELALQHAHKIEGDDKEAKAFLDGLVIPATAAIAPVVDPTLLAAAVAATLQAMGVTVPAKS